jgi:predicted NUDIX family NTP pyrophosphohydrolase
MTEVLLGHPGGPFWKNKDEGAWGIPKGLIAEGEDPLDAAKREFVEETSHMPRGDFISLGDAKQAGGKIVHVFALKSDWDAADFRSNSFEMEWPPKSGRLQSFPELGEVKWFSLTDAQTRIHKGQITFLDRLKLSVK